MEKDEEDSEDNGSARSLPHTSRICSKIREYYRKFGYKRDLDKFLRVYSPTQQEIVEHLCGLLEQSLPTEGTRTEAVNTNLPSNDYERSVNSLKAASSQNRIVSQGLQQPSKPITQSKNTTIKVHRSPEGPNRKNEEFSITFQVPKQSKEVQEGKDHNSSPGSLNFNASGKALTSTRIGKISKEKEKEGEEDKSSHHTYCLDSDESITTTGPNRSIRIKSLPTGFSQRHVKIPNNKKQLVGTYLELRLEGGNLVSKVSTEDDSDAELQTKEATERTETPNTSAHLQSPSNHVESEQRFLSVSDRDSNVSQIDVEIDLVIGLLGTLINSRNFNEHNRRKIMRYVMKHVARLTAGESGPNKLNDLSLGPKKNVTVPYQTRNTSSDSSIAQLYRVQNLRQRCSDGEECGSTQALPGSKAVLNSGSSGGNHSNVASQTGPSTSKRVHHRNMSDTSISNECIVEVKVYKNPEEKIHLEEKCQKQKKKKKRQERKESNDDDEYKKEVDGGEEEEIYYSSPEMDANSDDEAKERRKEKKDDKLTAAPAVGAASDLEATANGGSSTSGVVFRIDIHDKEEEEEHRISMKIRSREREIEEAAKDSPPKEESNNGQEKKRKSGGGVGVKILMDEKKKKNPLPSNRSIPSQTNASLSSMFQDSEKQQTTEYNWLHPLTRSEIAYEMDALKCPCGKPGNHPSDMTKGDDDDDDETKRRLNYVEDKIRYLERLKRILLQEQKREYQDSIHYRRKLQKSKLTESQEEGHVLMQKDSMEMFFQDMPALPKHERANVYRYRSANEVKMATIGSPKKKKKNTSQPSSTLPSPSPSPSPTPLPLTKQPVTKPEDKVTITRKLLTSHKKSPQQIPTGNQTLLAESESKMNFQEQSSQGMDNKRPANKVTKENQNKAKEKNNNRLTKIEDDNDDDDGGGAGGGGRGVRRSSNQAPMASPSNQDSDNHHPYENSRKSVSQYALNYRKGKKSSHRVVRLIEEKADDSKIIDSEANSKEQRRNVKDDDETTTTFSEGLYLDIPIEVEKDSVAETEAKNLAGSETDIGENIDLDEEDGDGNGNGIEMYFLPSSARQMTAIDTPSLSGSGDDYDISYLIQQRTNHFMDLYHKKEMELQRLQELHRQYQDKMLRHKFCVQQMKQAHRLNGGGEQMEKKMLDFNSRGKSHLTMSETTTTTTTMTTTTKTTTTTDHIEGDNWIRSSIQSNGNGNAKQPSSPKEKKKSDQTRQEQQQQQQQSKGSKDARRRIFLQRKVAPTISSSAISTTESHVPRSLYSSDVSKKEKAKSIAFAVPLLDNSDRKGVMPPKRQMRDASTSSQQDKDLEFLTLQECLAQAKPRFLRDSQHRAKLLNKMQKIRTRRQRCIRNVIDQFQRNDIHEEQRLPSSGIDSGTEMEYVTLRIPPPVSKCVRILDAREMKARTQRNFHRLPEVVAKRQRESHEKFKQSNRILQNIFNERLQQRVHHGKVSFQHGESVI